MNEFKEKYKVTLGPKLKKINRFKTPTFYHMYDKSGNKLGKINQRYAMMQNQYLKGVSLFVINEQGNVLIEKRVNKGLTPGKLDLCSGHLDNEETYLQAAQRELQEELGIPKQETQHNIIMLGEEGTIPLSFKSNETIKKFFIQFGLIIRNTSDVRIQEKEVDTIYYLPMQEVFELIRQGKTKFPYHEKMEQVFKQIEILYNKSKEQQTR